MSEERQAFLKELTALSLKHKQWIGGCGCCNSPFVVEFDPQFPEQYDINGQYYTISDRIQWLTDEEADEERRWMGEQEAWLNGDEE